MQIMKRHAPAIFLGRTRLSWEQRYQFLCGWLPWISDGLGLIVTLFALVWTALMTIAPNYFDVPMEALSAAALALFSAKTLKTLLLYPQKVGSGVVGAVLASTAGLALTHTVGKAVLGGLFTSRKPFLRTPKCQNPTELKEALRLVWQEASLLGLCVLAVLAMLLIRGFDDPAATLWMTMLAIQCLPYAATLITACVSAASYRSLTVTAPVIVVAPATVAIEPVLPRAA